MLLTSKSFNFMWMSILPTYAYILPTYMSACAPCVYLVPVEARTGVRSLESQSYHMKQGFSLWNSYVRVPSWSVFIHRGAPRSYPPAEPDVASGDDEFWAGFSFLWLGEEIISLSCPLTLISVLLPIPFKMRQNKKQAISRYIVSWA